MEPRIENPWHKLPAGPPYVLPDEAEPIAKRNASAAEVHKLRLELLPEPYLGNPTAPVVILNLNPGFSPEDPKQHADPVFASRVRANLLHEPSDYPFFFLDPKLRGPGWRWWNKRLRELIEAVGREKVARQVCCVELFPYHSVRFRWLVLPSQQYSFDLVRQAMARGALIIVMRSWSKWLWAVPELETYPNLHRLRSHQSPYITPRNCPEGFALAVQTLKSSAAA